jgi:restriction endonuclease S subunit
MMEIRSKSKGSAQGVITKEMINNLHIPLPERIADQEKILLNLDTNLEKAKLVGNSLSQLTKESLGLRRSLLQAAFTGQLTKEVACV